MIHLVHTADVHFGVENYGKTDVKTGIHSRLLDFKKAFDKAVDFAIDQKTDLFLLCGDAYKTPYPTPTQQKLLAQSLFRLYAAKIPVAIVVGNHDHPLSFGKANALDVFDYLPLDEGFHVFSKPQIKVIPTKNGPIQVVGMPWPTRNTLLSQAKHQFKNNRELTLYLSSRVGFIIKELAAQLDPTIPAILMGHLTVSSGIFSGSEKCAIFGTDPILTPSQLAIAPFDYVALGHLHRYQDLNPKGFPSIVYSGSIERVDFGERKEEKGFCEIIIDKDVKKKSLESTLEEDKETSLSPKHTLKDGWKGTGNCRHRFHELKTRRMIQINATLQAQVNQTDQIINELKKHTLEGAIIKIKYKVPLNITDKVDIAAIQRFCKPAQYLVGIIPEHEIQQRSRRENISTEMAMEKVILTYLESKEELESRRPQIISKALKLIEANREENQPHNE